MSILKLNLGKVLKEMKIELIMTWTRVSRVKLWYNFAFIRSFEKLGSSLSESR